MLCLFYLNVELGNNYQLHISGEARTERCPAASDFQHWSLLWGQSATIDHAHDDDEEHLSGGVCHMDAFCCLLCQRQTFKSIILISKACTGHLK